MKGMRAKTLELGMAVLVAIASLTAAAAPLGAQEDVIVLRPRSPVEGQRPGVTFPHARHADQLDCLRCHHDFDALGNNTGSEGQACIDCHDEAGSNPVRPTLAYHLQCKQCHQALNASGHPSLPVMCGQCHRR